MPRFTDLDEEFVCPYRHGCPYLEGLSAKSVWHRYQEAAGLECHYEHQLQQLQQQHDQGQRRIRELEREVQQLQAQNQALHRRQFKGRKTPATAAPQGPAASPKKRGAPAGHPPWQRPQPEHIDQVIPVPAPKRCPHCRSAALQPLARVQEHVQEDIVLQPRTIATCYVHQQAYCPGCDRNVLLPGPGELPGSYIGPAAKATAAYLRQELNVPYRKISRFFADFFGLKFVPASAYGFERQAVRRALPLYADLLDKVRSLAVVHADETSWRHDGRNFWVWYAGNDDLAIFRLDAHRSAEAAQELLGERFDGVLVADAYASYNGIHPRDRQSCLAHIKSKAKELDQELALLKGRAADPAARRFCQDIQGLVRDACLAHRKLSKGPWRAMIAKAKGRALRQRLKRICRTPLCHPRTETFRQRLLGKEQKLLFTCFRRPNVPPTNNQAERSLRPVVIMRRVIQGTRSHKGLENHGVLRSLFETSRRQGKKPHRFFLDLFTKTTPQAQNALYRKTLDTKSVTSKSSGTRKPP
jgi:transposase